MLVSQRELHTCVPSKLVSILTPVNESIPIFRNSHLFPVPNLRVSIIEWLLSHEECPCCRHNYLSFSEESEIEMTEIEREEHRRNVSILRTPTATVTAAAGDDEAQLLRGLQLIYQYSREPMLPSSSSLLPAPPPVIGNGENIGDNDNGHEDAASVHGGSDIRADAAEDDADGHADLETGAISVVAELVPVEESYSAEPDSRDRSEPANVTIGAEEEE